jgi:predicted Zn-dependent protease
MSILKYHYILIFVFCIETTFAQLPDFSVQSSSVEKHKGVLFARSLWESGAVNSDIENILYIQNLGQRLLKNINSPKKFKFMLLNIGQINAFAGPDANIGIFSGLLEVSSNESELASVFAHEIAHVTQNHLNRYSKKNANSSTLILASILVAIASSNAQVSNMVLLSTTAGVAQRGVNFTRAHEWEADRKGIEILYKSGFSVTGMAGFFKKLLQFDKGSSLEFLRTHPLSINRIAQATQLAQQYKGGVTTSFAYQIVKAKLKKANNKKENFSPIINLYMKTLEALNQRKYLLAETLADRLIKKNRSSTTKVLVARIKAKNKKLAEAIKLFNSLNNNEIKAYYLAQAYFDNGKQDKATQILRRFLKSYGGSFYSYKKLASFYLKQKKMVKFHLTMSDAFIKKYAFLEAKQQLMRAKANTYDEYYLSRISAKTKRVDGLIERFDN